MAANFVLLEKITVGAAGASSATFSSIPQSGYTDLVVKYSLRNASNNTSLQVTFNDDGTRTNYSYKQFYGSGSASVLDGQSDIFWGQIDPSSYTANTFSNGEMYIPNYLSANKKSVTSDAVLENNAQAAVSSFLAGLWQGTAAINKISFSCYTGSFAQYSTFYLYGVAKLGTTPAIVPYATGGDTIMTDGTYWYHAFVSSGTFTPQKGLSCDVLAVAGGAGGAGGTFTNANSGGGGGAGGLAYSTGNSVSSAQTVTIGAGGAGGNTSTGVGANGVNSVFGSLTAAVGGGGGGAEGVLNNGFNGRGSNGGSGGGNTENRSVATGTSGQGNNGGNGTAGAGGGGGAGAVGSDNSGSTPGPGGAGVNTYSAFLSATGLGVSGYIAGGGGAGKYQAGAGAVGGSGGGGTGGSGGTDDDTAGTTNTGSGGGGSSNQAAARAGSAGGSGLVIVRYAV